MLESFVSIRRCNERREMGRICLPPSSALLAIKKFIVFSEIETALSHLGTRQDLSSEASARDECFFGTFVLDFGII